LIWASDFTIRRPIFSVRHEHDCVCGVEPAPVRPNVWRMATAADNSRASPKTRALRRGAAILDAQLDLALAHTFPASDPVAVGHPTGTEPPSRPVDRWPPIIDG
jgi:hypothetical protein